MEGTLIRAVQGLQEHTAGVPQTRGVFLENVASELRLEGRRKMQAERGDVQGVGQGEGERKSPEWLLLVQRLSGIVSWKSGGS